MNEVYFTCHTCKTYINAGYRWCYVHLEKPGVVAKGERVSVDDVFQATQYWDCEDSTDGDSSELRHCLQEVALFLEKHKAHHIIYDEDQSFLWQEGQYDWMDEEENPQKADLSPRYLVERLKITKWQEVIEYLNHLEHHSRPFWFVFEDETESARLKFEELVKQ